MSTYLVGTTTSSIRFHFDLTTIGLAASRAVLYDETNDNPVSVGTSVDATGDITWKTLVNANLPGRILTVLCKVDFSLLGDEKTRKKEFEKLKAVCGLDDGEEGSKRIDQPDHKIAADDFSVAHIYFIIHLQ